MSLGVTQRGGRTVSSMTAILLTTSLTYILLVLPHPMIAYLLDSFAFWGADFDIQRKAELTEIALTVDQLLLSINYSINFLLYCIRYVRSYSEKSTTSCF